MPSVTEHTVICPVGRKGTDGRNCDIINKEHDNRKNRESCKTVGNNLIDLIGGRKLTGRLFLVTAFNNLTDINIAFIRDDGFRIVVQFIFHRLYICFNVLQNRLIKLYLFEHLIVAFKNLDSIPTLLFLGKIMYRRLLDMSQCMLYST